MKSVDRLLKNTREQLTAANELLKQDESGAERGKSKLARENAKRAAKLVKKTRDSIKDHRDLLLEAKSRK